MNFYVVSGKSPKALAVYDVDGLDRATTLAKKEFGPRVIVLDEELYQLEQRIAPERARNLARRLMRNKHLKARKKT